MEVIYSLHAQRFLDKCAPELRLRIHKKISFYASTPNPLDFAEHLTDDPEAPYRFRIGKDWRVKFSAEAGLIKILRIGRRDQIYRT